MMRPAGDRRARRAVAVLSVALVAASTGACSYVTRPAAATAQTLVPGQPGAPGAQPGRPGAPGPGAVPGAPGSIPGSSAGVPGAPGVGPNGSTTGSDGGVVTPRARHGGGGPKVAGSSCTRPVTLGISYTSDGATTASAAGYKGTENLSGQGLQKAYQAAIDDLNAHGGLVGCRVLLDWYDFKVGSSSTYDQEAQEECQKFAQDDHVFAVIPLVHEGWTVAACLAKYGVPVFEANPGTTLPTTRADFANGLLYASSHIAWDRLGPEIDLLHSAGYFDGWNAGNGTPGAGPTKVGILIAQDPRGIVDNLMRNAWEPRLKALGIPYETFTAAPIRSAGDLSVVAQQMNNAIVQFRGDGVEHVLLAPGAGEDFVLFSMAADNQGYYPRIGIDSTDRPQTFTSSDAHVLAGAIGMSWLIDDVSAQAHPPANPSNAVRTRCASLYKAPAAAAGQPVTLFYAWCDTLDLLRSALAGQTSYPTTAELKSGVDRMGNAAVAMAAGYGSSFGSGKYDGGQVVRLMKFVYDGNSAGDWQYVSAAKVLP